MLRALPQLGVHVAHRVDHRLHHEVQGRRPRAAEQVRVAHRATQDAPQHVAAALVRREHAVREQERDRARVVGDDAVRRRIVAADDVVRRAAAIRRADDLLDRRDQRREQVAVEVVRDALQDRGDALESRARVDRRLRERHERAVRLPVELHEDEVPDLEEPPRLGALDERVGRELAAIQLRPLARRAVGEAEVGREVREVDVDLRARTARARVGHLPEVVLRPEPVDPRVRHAGDLAPERARLVVLVEDRDAQVLRGHLQLLGDELPREADRVALEVVAEREVAEHLEERVMPGGVADLLEIVVLAAGAHALLRRRRAARPVRRLLHAQEDLLELDHPRIREQQRGIVAGDERGGRADGVVLPLEELQEAGADLGGVHPGSIPDRRRRAQAELPTGRREMSRAAP